MTLPSEATPLLAAYATEITRPTAARFQTLLIAVLLTTGRQTVTCVLRTLRHLAPGQATAYRRVLYRAQWFGLQLDCILARFLIDRFGDDETIPFVGDDTVEYQTAMEEGVLSQESRRNNYNFYYPQNLLGTLQYDLVRPLKKFFLS